MIQEIKGTKSTKIMELINRKLQQDKEKMLEKHLEDNQLKKVTLEYEQAKKILDEISLRFDKRKDELDLEKSYDGKYRIKEKCRISKKDYDKLQAAQDLYSIGKRDDANKIWEEMIKKHNLLEVI